MLNNLQCVITKTTNNENCYACKLQALNLKRENKVEVCTQMRERSRDQHRTTQGIVRGAGAIHLTSSSALSYCFYSDTY